MWFLGFDRLWLGLRNRAGECCQPACPCVVLSLPLVLLWNYVWELTLSVGLFPLSWLRSCASEPRQFLSSDVLDVRIFHNLPTVLSYFARICVTSCVTSGGIMEHQTSLYPCEPWPIDPSCCPDWPEDTEQWTDRHRQAQWLATVDLWRAVGGIIGLCRAVVRPCLDECRTTSGMNRSGWMMPHIFNGQWYNTACGCRGDCSCSRLCTVTLPGPVWDIISVKVNGEVLPCDAYRVVVGDRVARVDGSCWPSCQDFSRPDDDGFTIEYLRGQPVRADAIRAVSILACRKLRSCGPGGNDCGDLPDGVTSITREGISMRVDDDTGQFDSGIGAVNDWVQSINPYGLTEYPSVWSPDVPEPIVFYEGPVRTWR